MVEECRGQVRKGPGSGENIGFTLSTLAWACIWVGMVCVCVCVCDMIWFDCE